MSRPVVGIVGNHHLLNDTYRIHGAGLMISDSVANVAGCLPLIVPSDPALVDIDDLMETCDGFLFPGGRPNVHPEEYGQTETEAHGAFDRDRDRIALPLIRALTERGQPYLAICRGYQEVAVAFGSDLHPEIRDLPGRENHRMPPDGTIEEKLSEFGLSVEEAALVREFQENFSLCLFPKYLRLRGKAKRYHQKYGDYFAF